MNQVVASNPDLQFTSADILRVVASSYELTVKDLTSKARTSTRVRARMMAVMLMSEYTINSISEIGERLGGRDQSTIAHLRRRFKKLSTTDPRLKAELQQLRMALFRAAIN